MGEEVEILEEDTADEVTEEAAAYKKIGFTSQISTIILKIQSGPQS